MEGQEQTPPWGPPEGSKHHGLMEKLRAKAPSQECLKKQAENESPWMKEYVAQGLVQLDVEAADILVNYSKDQRSLVEPLSANNVKPTQDVKKRPHNIPPAAGVKRSESSSPPSQGQPKKRKEETYIPKAAREAFGRVLAKYMHTRSIEQLQQMIKQSGFVYNQDQLLKSNHMVTIKKSDGVPPKDTLAETWTDDKLERCQLHLCLGLVLVCAYDERKQLPLAKRNKGVAMYQWFFFGTNINHVGDLSREMRTTENPLLPAEPKLAEEEMLKAALPPGWKEAQKAWKDWCPKYDPEDALRLLKQVGDWEYKTYGVGGLWPEGTLGRVVPVRS